MFLGILEKEQEQSVVYGSTDFGKTCATNEKYKELSDLRRNLSSIPFAYLHNVFSDKNRILFRQLYPKFSDIFNKYDEEIYKIVKLNQTKLNIH